MDFALREFEAQTLDGSNDDHVRVVSWIGDNESVVSPYKNMMGDSNDTVEKSKALISSFNKKAQFQIKDKDNFSVVIYLALINVDKTEPLARRGPLGIAQIRYSKKEGKEVFDLNVALEYYMQGKNHEAYLESANFERYARSKTNEILGLN